MPRKLRVEYPGAIYHVINRGDRREPIFKDDQDRELFLSALGECCEKTGWQIHAYCLMPNHFHLVVETPRGNLVAGMKWFLGTYTLRFNRRHKLFGHLFSGRYKALVVDGSGSGYLKTVCDYVHLNPPRARLLQPQDPLRAFVWSSYQYYLRARTKRPDWLRVNRLLGEHGIPKDSVAGRRQFEARMERGRAAEDGREYRLIRRGWCYGEKAFRTELIEQIAGQAGEHHYAEDRHESDQQKARRIIASELKRLRWEPEELGRRRKGDRRKVKIAMRLRQETTMTLKWVAEALHMGAWTHVSNLLSRERRGSKSPP
jgi:REP element-mobilizing transposase RayT